MRSKKHTVIEVDPSSSSARLHMLIWSPQLLKWGTKVALANERPLREVGEESVFLWRRDRKRPPFPISQMPRSPVLSPTNDQRLMGFLYPGEHRQSSWQVSLCARHPSHASGGGVIPGSCQTL